MNIAGTKNSVFAAFSNAFDLYLNPKLATTMDNPKENIMGKKDVCVHQV